MKPNPFLGRWRIVDMDEWDEAYRDLVVPAYFEFEPGNGGTFQFGTVSGGLDCQYDRFDHDPFVEFSWAGMSDSDLGSGRGWALLLNDEMSGRIFIHGSDNSFFDAVRGVGPRRRFSSRRGRAPLPAASSRSRAPARPRLGNRRG